MTDKEIIEKKCTECKWYGTISCECPLPCNCETKEYWSKVESNSIKIELEPCVDCVSRKELLSRIDAERRHLLDIGMDGAEHIIVHHARRIIEGMPSVKPTRPKGKWIPLEGDLKKCPVCGEHSLCPSKFCCSCGAELEV